MFLQERAVSYQKLSQTFKISVFSSFSCHKILWLEKLILTLPMFFRQNSLDTATKRPSRLMLVIFVKKYVSLQAIMCGSTTQ